MSFALTVGHQEEEAVAERFAEAAARGSQQAKKDLAADAVLHGARARGRGGLGDWIDYCKRRAQQQKEDA